MPRLKRRARSGEKKYLPAPLVDLISVFEPFLDEYAARREAGMDQSDSMAGALGSLLPEDKLVELANTLNGDRDEFYSQVGPPFDGQELAVELAETGDDYWQKLKILSDRSRR